MNTVLLKDIEVVFIDTSVAMEKDYLEYNVAMQFRCFSSNQVVAWATKKVLCKGVLGLYRSDLKYGDARLSSHYGGIGKDEG